ncbi:MAG TPA: hypothetical protein VGL91_04615 [Acidobacteriota bacterium]
MTKHKIPPDLPIWIDARKRHHLSHAQIQMARELGMNPKRFGKLDNHRQEPWKMPLPQFIEHLYFEHFGKARPDRAVSIEERAAEISRKKVEKKALKQARRQSELKPNSSGVPESEETSDDIRPNDS